MFDSSAAAAQGGWRVRQGRSPREARASRVTQIRRSELRIEAMALRDAADWASEHGVDADDRFATGPAGGVGTYVASDGTPWVDEHVAKEYGALRGTSTFEATDLIIDALDLRHRFRRIWRAIKRLQIRVRDARRISKQCRDLSREAAAAVDAELFRTAALGLPWPRLSRIVSAAVINADPALHQAKLAAAKFDRTVWLSESEHGLRTMVIKADEGDQILLYALVERIAEILELDGDSDPIDQRRSKAAGWLARPEDLVVLLYQHSTQSKPQPEPAGDAPDRDHERAAHDRHVDADEPAPPAAASTPDQHDEEARDDDARDDEARHEEPGNSAPSGVSRTEGASTADASPTAGVEPTADVEPAADVESAAGDADGSTGPVASDQSTNATEPATPSEPATPPESATPQPPADWPGFDWNCPEPEWSPGVSDRLPTPRSRFYRTEHLPDAEPPPPPWCYPPPDDHADPPGSRLSCDVPRLVDYLTTKGLKPARPRVVMNVHLTDQTLLTGDGVVRVEDSGPMLLTQLLELLGNHHCQVSLRPVLDPANLAAVDTYEIPQALRDAVRLRHPASVFPYSSRQGSKLELDHTIPHSHTDEPGGQTRVGNLGPLARPEHQSKTDGVWHVDQPHPGVYLWRSPHGHYFLVTNHGTQALGPKPTP